MSKFAKWYIGIAIAAFAIVALTFVVLYAVSDFQQLGTFTSKTRLPNPRFFFKSFFAKKGHEMFDHVFYTNLDARTDRRYQIESELQRIGFPESKITRNPGIIDKYGALGCAKAILNALLRFEAEKSWQTCLFMEDDLVFVENANFVNEQLLKFLTLNVEWDVLMLSSNTIRYETINLIDFIVKIIDAQTTAAFAVHRKFLPTLIANVKQGISKLETSKNSNYCIDMYWKILQPSNNFFTFHPLIAHQRDSYSDIEERFITSYNDKKPLQIKLNKSKYIFCVKMSKEDIKDISFLPKHDEIDYFYYYADPDLAQEYSYNQQTNILQIKTDDSCLGSCQKVLLMMKYVSSFIELNDCLQSNLKGVVLLNNESLKKFNFDLLEEKSNDREYWGPNQLSNSSFLSNRFIGLCKSDKTFLSLIQSRCPPLEFLPVAVPQLTYFTTDFLFLTTKIVTLLSHLDSFFMQFPKPNQLQFHLSKNKQNYENLCLFDDLQIALALKSIGRIC